MARLVTADQPDKLRELIAITRQTCEDYGCDCADPEDEDCMGHRAEALADALEAALVVIDARPGCSDGSCKIQRPTGMHTNGGCRCFMAGNDSLRRAGMLAWDRLQKARWRA